MNIDLLKKVQKFDLKYILKNKGYVFFEKGDYNLNIIGVRCNKINQNDLFEDLLILTFKNNSFWETYYFSITTTPGIYYLNKPLSKSGCAIVFPNQYRGLYKIGLHKGKYEALVQKKKIQIYRDNNKDNILDFDLNTLKEQENLGINIHGPYKKNTILNKIGKYSAGCQVFQSYNELEEFLNICKKSAEIYGNSFTYTLLEEKDF